MALHVAKGGTAPSFTPTELGMHYIDTVNGKHYLSIGTASPLDWVLIGSGSGGTPAVDDVTFITLNEPVEGTNLYDILNHSLSSFVLRGFDVTDNLDGTINVAEGDICLRTSALNDSPLVVVKVAGVVNLALTDNIVNSIVINYNSGSPEIVATTDLTACNIRDCYAIYSVTRIGTTLHFVDLRELTVDPLSGFIKRLTVQGLYSWASGAAISHQGVLKIGVTAGRFYIGPYGINTLAFNTNVSDVFKYIYRNGAGGWIRVPSQTAIDVLRYDNGSGLLATLGNNKYAVHWVFVINNEPDELGVMYGRGEYDTIAAAQQASLPSDLPPEFNKYGSGIFIGKIIIQKSGTSFVDIQSPFVTTLTSASPTTHNNLSGLQGGISGEFYHLSLAQHTIATQAATTSLSGYLSSVDWNTFNNKVSSQWITSGSDIYYTAGNAGIGTTSPTARFHVKGTGTTSASNPLRIENGASVNIFSAFDDGSISGKQLSLGVYSGSLKIGEDAAPNSTSGAVTAIGYKAAYSATTATGYLAIGSQAGYSATDQINWLAIGYLAGYSNSTGNTWLAIGFQAAKSNVSGSQWLAIGRYAGYNNQSGSNWVAIGRDTGFSNLTGDSWLALGYQAGFYNVNGSNWTAIGSQAGRYVKGGTASLEYFTDSVYIGSYTKGTNGTSGTPTTNETVIGTNAEGNGSNTVTIGSSAVTDQYLKGMVHSSGCYAEIHVHDSSASQSIAAGTTYTKVTAFTDNGFSANCTPDATNDKITFTKTGVYKVSCTANFSSGTSNTIFWLAPFLNGVEQDHIHIKRKISTSGDVGSATMVGIIDVTSISLDLDIRARHEDGSPVDLTIEYANLTVEYLGET